MPAAHDTAPRTTAWPLGCKQEGLALEPRGRGRGHPTATWRGKCPWVYRADPVPKKSELRFLRASAQSSSAGAAMSGSSTGHGARLPRTHTRPRCRRRSEPAGKSNAQTRVRMRQGHARAASAAAGPAASAPRPAGHACRAWGPVGASASDPPPPASLKPLARTGSHVSHCVIFHSHCSGIERRGTCRISPSSSSPSTRSAE